uniref:(northern house mosquito) hypothetical protein n=1 Tax=Culex pipiens TaxID=7175 RepID=A0A8D8HTM0_CULPI
MGAEPAPFASSRIGRRSRAARSRRPSRRYGVPHQQLRADLRRQRRRLWQSLHRVAAQLAERFQQHPEPRPGPVAVCDRASQKPQRGRCQTVESGGGSHPAKLHGELRKDDPDQYHQPFDAHRIVHRGRRRPVQPAGQVPHRTTRAKKLE